MRIDTFEKLIRRHKGDETSSSHEYDDARLTKFRQLFKASKIRSLNRARKRYQEGPPRPGQLLDDEWGPHYLTQRVQGYQGSCLLNFAFAKHGASFQPDCNLNPFEVFLESLWLEHRNLLDSDGCIDLAHVLDITPATVLLYQSRAGDMLRLPGTQNYRRVPANAAQLHCNSSQSKDEWKKWDQTGFAGPWQKAQYTEDNLKDLLLITQADKSERFFMPKKCDLHIAMRLLDKPVFFLLSLSFFGKEKSREIEKPNMFDIVAPNKKLSDDDFLTQKSVCCYARGIYKAGVGPDKTKEKMRVYFAVIDGSVYTEAKIDRLREIRVRDCDPLIDRKAMSKNLFEGGHFNMVGGNLGSDGSIAIPERKRRTEEVIPTQPVNVDETQNRDARFLLMLQLELDRALRARRVSWVPFEDRPPSRSLARGSRDSLKFFDIANPAMDQFDVDRDYEALIRRLKRAVRVLEEGNYYGDVRYCETLSYLAFQQYEAALYKDLKASYVKVILEREHQNREDQLLASSLYSLGRCQYRLKEYPNAELTFSKATGSCRVVFPKPYNHSALRGQHYLGMAQYAQRKYILAEYSFTLESHLLKMRNDKEGKPQDRFDLIRNHYWRGFAQYELGRYHAALAQMELARVESNAAVGVARDSRSEVPSLATIRLMNDMICARIKASGLKQDPSLKMLERGQDDSVRAAPASSSGKRFSGISGFKSFVHMFKNA